MDQLALIVGLLLATVGAVGLGEKLRLPYPVLMLILAVALTFIPGFPEIQIPPELILPIFLPPLLFATAQRSSWAVFRVRWRTLLMLAVALVVVSTAVVAGAAWLMIPGIGIPAAIALGAMVAPPDPVAVDSIASRVHMPRRLINVLRARASSTTPPRSSSFRPPWPPPSPAPRSPPTSSSSLSWVLRSRCWWGSAWAGSRA